MNCPNCKSDIEAVIKERIEGTVCEISYICKVCGEVGYWAYGYFHPDYPYQG